MLYPEKRSLVHFLGTVVLSMAYACWVWASFGSRLVSDSETGLWSLLILGFIPLYIMTWVLLHVGFVIFNKILTNEDAEDVDDEREKAIKGKASRWQANLLVLALGLALLTQVLGLPLSTFFLVLSLGLLASSLGMDLALWIYQLRGS